MQCCRISDTVSCFQGFCEGEGRIAVLSNRVAFDRPRGSTSTKLTGAPFGTESDNRPRWSCREWSLNHDWDVALSEWLRVQADHELALFTLEPQWTLHHLGLP